MPKAENEIRLQLEKGRLTPDTDRRHKRIHAAIRKFFADGEVFHILGQTPGQEGDHFSILADDEHVLTFELTHGTWARPQDAKVFSLASYRKELGRTQDSKEIKIALEVARKALGLPPRAWGQSIGAEKAQALAEAELARLEDECGYPLVFLGSPDRGAFGWLYHFGSAAYAKSRKFQDIMVGHGPMLVSRKGNVYVLPSYLDTNDRAVRAQFRVTHP